MEKLLREYRLYLVDRTGKIIGLESLDADTDNEAVNLARALNKSWSCEVWNRTKFIRAIAGADVPSNPRSNA